MKDQCGFFRIWDFRNLSDYFAEASGWNNSSLSLTPCTVTLNWIPVPLNPMSSFNYNFSLNSSCCPLPKTVDLVFLHFPHESCQPRSWKSIGMEFRLNPGDMQTSCSSMDKSVPEVNGALRTRFNPDCSSDLNCGGSEADFIVTTWENVNKIFSGHQLRPYHILI